MHPHEQKQNRQGNQLKFSVNLVAMMAMMLYLPLRCKYGRRHLGLWPLVGFFIVFLWAGVSHCHYLLWLIPINAFIWVQETIGAMVRRYKGVREHTHYTGFPYVTFFIFRDEDFCKLIVEPLLSIGIGWLFYRYSDQPNTATFFWWGAVAMFMYQSMVRDQHNRIIEEGQNAGIEQEYYMNKVKRRA